MLLIFIFLLICATGLAEISSSSDLNCDFSSAKNCRWRNSTEGGAMGHFEVTTLLEADAMNRIMPLDENDATPFAYTAGLMGRTLALLVSEVITCQLGGASIKYWYYKTGQDSQLEVCIRQPPGNRDINAMRCYDGVSSTFGKQWIFRAVELPPIAQPFEIVFKTFYSPPSDVIALDNISFEATLCGARSRRDIRRIGYQDWQTYRKSKVYSGELMLIVAQDVADDLRTSTMASTLESIPMELGAKIHILESSTAMMTTTSTTTTTTTTMAPTTTEAPAPTTTSSSTSLPSSTSSEPPTPAEPSLSNEQHFANFVNFLKQTAPVIPYIPTLVRSLSALDPRIPEPPTIIDAVAPPTDLRRSPVISSHFYNTNQPTLWSTVAPAPTSIPTLESQETLVDLAKKFGLLEPGAELTTVAMPTLAPSVAPKNLNNNNFGMPNKMDSVLLYPQELLKHKRNKITISPIKKVEKNFLEKEDLEKVHRQIFKTTTALPPTTDLIIFKQPSSGESEVAEKLAGLAQFLPSGAVNDLTSLRNIPDLEGLTKGMDLTDIRKPGGFSRLKKQFMERLMRRTLGLPIENDDVRVLPPPIVPMKVTRKMMAEMMKRRRKAAL